MSFETDIKKLQKMWEAQQDNTQALTDAQIAQNLIAMNVEDYLPSALTINSINNIGGGYQTIASLMTTPYQVSGFVWTITKVLPEVWIPNIRIDVGYNFPGTDAAFENMPSYFNKVLNVKPVAGSTSLVTATWQVGLYFVSYDPTNLIPTFQARLYFYLVDPSVVA